MTDLQVVPDGCGPGELIYMDMLEARSPYTFAASCGKREVLRDNKQPPAMSLSGLVHLEE